MPVVILPSTVSIALSTSLNIASFNYSLNHLISPLLLLRTLSTSLMIKWGCLGRSLMIKWGCLGRSLMIKWGCLDRSLMIK